MINTRVRIGINGGRGCNQFEPCPLGHTEPVECASEINVHIKILPVRQVPLYQKVAQKATQLRLLGMTYRQIAKSLHVSKKAVLKALNYYKSPAP